MDFEYIGIKYLPTNCKWDTGFTYKGAEKLGIVKCLLFNNITLSEHCIKNI